MSLGPRFTVAPQSPYDGATVGQLELPPGCILILLRRGASEEVPLPTTTLVAGDQLTVIIAAHSVAAVRLLHQGVGVA